MPQWLRSGAANALRSLIFVATFVVVIGALQLLAGTSAAATGGGALAYGTFVGGSLWEEANGLAVDYNGNAHITGYTTTPGFITETVRTAPTHGIDVYTVRIRSGGSVLDYVNYVDPANALDEDYAYGIALAAEGAVYVAGSTRSADFCSGGLPGYDTSYNGNNDAFLLKLDSDGNMIYCSYLGGTDVDQANALIVMADGSIVLGGSTWSADFPATAGSYDGSHNGLRDGFVAKLNAAGDTLAFATFIGGEGQEEITALAAVPSGAVEAVGWTNSGGAVPFPTTEGAFDESHNGTFDAFVLQLTPAGDRLAYSTFLGGDDADRAYGVAVGAGGVAVVTGPTRSADFPVTPGAFDTSFGGGICGFDPCDDVFVAAVNGDGSDLLFSSYLGGTGADVSRGVDLDADGRVLVAGSTESPTFPTSPDAFDNTLDGPTDAFLAKLDAAGGSLAYGSFFGGGNEEVALAVALHGEGAVTLAGRTRSPGFPVTPWGYDITHNGDYDIFVLQLPAPPGMFRAFLPVNLK